jgi:hypothetical protein
LGFGFFEGGRAKSVSPVDESMSYKGTDHRWALRGVDDLPTSTNLLTCPYLHRFIAVVFSQMDDVESSTATSATLRVKFRSPGPSHSDKRQISTDGESRISPDLICPTLMERCAGTAVKYLVGIY